MRIELQPAYIIHRRAYRNTSWLLDAFTCEHGLVAMVAKGAKRPGHAWRFLLEPFKPLLLSFSGRGELMTLLAAEQGGRLHTLSGDAIYAGMYLNELLQRLLHRNDPHEALYSMYADALHELAVVHSSIEPALRRFELGLLRELGYGLQLDHNFDTDQTYYYDVEHGPVAGNSPTGNWPLVSGRCLVSLADGNFSNPEILREMKRLLRSILNHYLAGRPLKSRELFSGEMGTGRSGDV